MAKQRFPVDARKGLGIYIYILKKLKNRKLLLIEETMTNDFSIVPRILPARVYEVIRI